MVHKKRLPSVSFVIPTYNAEVHLPKCLASINEQNYPRNKYEILVADGGSDDRTVEIAKRYGATVIKNKRKIAEFGGSLGMRRAKGDYVVLMGADNEIIKKDWLRKMIIPLMMDPDLFGVESYYYYKDSDSIFNKYSMVIHVADPFARSISGKIVQKKRQNYIECMIVGKATYPLGANGFVWNKRIIEEVGGYKMTFEEANMTSYILKKGYRKFARVPGYGVYHDHVSSLGDFIRKRIKIANKFLLRRREGRETWVNNTSRIKFAFCAIYCISIVGPLVEGVYCYSKTKEKYWLLHPIMCFIAVTVYIFVFVKNRIFC